MWQAEADTELTLSASPATEVGQLALGTHNVLLKGIRSGVSQGFEMGSFLATHNPVIHFYSSTRDSKMTFSYNEYEYWRF